MRKDIELPPGFNGDDTAYEAQGRWADGNMVRFRLGMPEVYGGWESLTATLLNGVCRTVFPWTDNSAVLNIAFGTHTKVQLWQAGGVFDITPFGPPTPLPSNPLSVTNASAVVTVHHVAHGFATGLSLKLFGATAVGGITPNGTFTITVDDADQYHFTFGSSATSTAAGGGSGIVVTPQTELPAGALNGTASAGWGTGGYGDGPYGQSPSTFDFFPRTWSFDAWGQNLLASPRGGGIYAWTNNTGQRAVALDNAPTQVSYMLVAPLDGGYQVFALGCNQEADGVFNPMCVRHSSIRDDTEWSTLADGSTAREYILIGGGRIVGARMVGPYMLVWTNNALFLGSFVGSLNQPWRFDRIGLECGLIGPNAVIVVGQTAFWISPDLQFYRYDLGGAVSPVDCPIRSDFAENLAVSQGEKIVASSNAKFQEIRFDYPDARDGFENSRFLAAHVPTLNASPVNAWHRGIQARSAFVDSGASAYPIGTTVEGNVYYHERGQTADGQPLAWFIKSAAQLLDINWRLLLKGVWPDMRSQIGPITVTMEATEHPQDAPVAVGTMALAPGDAKADFLISGRLFSLQIAGASAPAGGRIGKPIVEYELAGKL